MMYVVQISIQCHSGRGAQRLIACLKRTAKVAVERIPMSHAIIHWHSSLAMLNIDLQDSRLVSQPMLEQQFTNG